MKYQEWIVLPEENMADIKADELIEMFSDLPYGMIEPDNEKQAKLTSMLLCYMSAGTLSRDKEFHTKLTKIGNAIVNLLPDDTHAQSFALGAMSVFVTFANTLDKLNSMNGV